MTETELQFDIRASSHELHSKFDRSIPHRTALLHALHHFKSCLGGSGHQILRGIMYRVK